MENKKNKNIKNRGFVNSVVMEGMITIAILGIILAIAISQYGAYKNRGYDREAIANANYAYEASQKLFHAKPKATATIEEISKYGYQWSSDITVNIEGGKENISIITKHNKSDKYYKINEKGEISKIATY